MPRPDLETRGSMDRLHGPWIPTRYGTVTFHVGPAKTTSRLPRTKECRELTDKEEQQKTASLNSMAAYPGMIGSLSILSAGCNLPELHENGPHHLRALQMDLLSAAAVQPARGPEGGENTAFHSVMWTLLAGPVCVCVCANWSPSSSATTRRH